jgi:hypothetical protein
LGEGSRRGKEGHGERKAKKGTVKGRLPASRIALVRPPACGIAPTGTAAAANNPEIRGGTTAQINEIGSFGRNGR